MKKYSADSDSSTKSENEFYRHHERMFLLLSENLWLFKPQNSAKYGKNDVGKIEDRPKQNADIR